jgi:hypothetical protein
VTARLNVNVNDETAVALRSLAAKQGTTVTEVVRRAVSVHRFLSDAQKRGDRIQLTDGRTTTLVVIL